MSESMLLGVATLVFVMMVIGLGLTIIEFRYGQPKREAEAAARDPVAVRAASRATKTQRAV